MRKIIHRLGLAGLGLALAVGLAGCGYGAREKRLPETGATLEGTIKYAGEPVYFAEVRVVTDTGSAVGTVGEDGRYKVENCPIGTVTITVNTDAAKGDYTSLTMSGRYKGPKGEGAAGGGRPPKFVNVDPKYADPEKSGIKTTVNAGSNTYDINLPR
jgi:hypothetical protein